MAVICLLLQLFIIVIFVRIILSWFPLEEGLFLTVQRLAFTATEWVMGPLRRILPPVRLGSMALDLSPIVVLIGIYVLQGLLC